jgi:hypothetical protein
MARYDFAERRRSTRTGRERGCWVYIPAEELRKADIDPSGPRPWYRVWGSPGGGVMLRLYTTPNAGRTTEPIS